jgi:effector-binding domain-containing protein
MSETCTFEDFPHQHTAQIRARTPVSDLPELLGRSYDLIAAAVEKSGLRIVGAPYTLYLNSDMDDLEVEIGFPVDVEFDGDDVVNVGEIPAGRYAACLYEGPYEGISTAYDSLAEWVQAQGVRPTGVSYEIYLNDPGETPPSELRTKILFPIMSS